MIKNRPMFYLSLICLGVAIFCLVAIANAEDLTNVQWLDCHDGDTCEFNVLLPAVFGTDIGVRLSGIDTPEINGKCAQEKLLAAQARDFLRSQIKGTRVVLLNVFRDKYFRIEAVVMANDVNLNQLMVQKGYAVLYNGTGARHDWCAP